MANPIPPPPYLGPLPTPQYTALEPNTVQYFVCAYRPSTGKWETSPLFGATPWDVFPTGYEYNPASTPLQPQIFIVTARVRPDGSIAPNVIEYPNWIVVADKGGTVATSTSPDPQAPPPPSPSPRCPPGFIWVDLSLDPSFEQYWSSDGSQPPGVCWPIGPTWPLWQAQPQCPPGTTWDPATETCKVLTIPPPSPPPPTPPPPPPTPPPPTPPPPGTTPQPCIPDPNLPGDELTQGLNCISENLIYLQYQLQQLLNQQGQPGQPINPDPVTCAQLTGLVLATNQSLLAIAKSIASINAGGAVDLSGVVGAIFQVVAQLQTYPPIWRACCALLGDKLDSIATAIQSSSGTDLTPVVDQLKAIVAEGDVANATFQWLEQQGFLTPEDLQLYSGLGWADSFFAMVRTFAYRAITNYLATFGISITPAGVSVAAPADTFAKDVGALFSGVLTIGDTAILPTVKSLVDQVKALLVPPGPTQLGVINVQPDAPVAAAISVALTAAAVAWLLSFAGVDEGESLTRMAEIVAGAVGFEELRDVVLGPLVRQGIALVAERQAKARFLQELPGTTSLQTYVAMGLLSHDRAKALSLLNGTSDELFPISQAASYRGLNPRQMLRLIETDIFPLSEIADELTFSGMRPASQERMLRAAPYLATASERSSLRSTLETAYVAGLLADQDLTNAVVAAEQNTDLAGLVLSRARLQKLIAETKGLETEYTSLFVGGLIDDVTYRQNLAALGLQPDTVNMIAGRAEARANVTLHRRELADAARQARTTQKEIDQAALRNFADGNIDAAALAAALIASGVIPTQAAALVDLAVLRKAGSLRWIYGLQLSPREATLLRDRVAALTDQRKRLQITDLEYVSQLQALGIPPKYVNALQAAADALISPKTAAFPITVETT